MAKLYKISDWQPGLADVYFHCPGCKCDHGVWTQKTEMNSAVWDFNGDMDKPTFSPSIKVTYPHEGITDICHSFIKDGMIQFLGDCTHELAGQTIEMEEIKG
jgi:hypothetical protein